MLLLALLVVVGAGVDTSCPMPVDQPSSVARFVSRHRQLSALSSANRRRRGRHDAVTAGQSPPSALGGPAPRLVISQFADARSSVAGAAVVSWRSALA
jgi:hypothetical protein